MYSAARFAQLAPLSGANGEGTAARATGKESSRHVAALQHGSSQRCQLGRDRVGESSCDAARGIRQVELDVVWIGRNCERAVVVQFQISEKSRG